MLKRQITLILMFIALICIFFQPVSASGSLKQMNVTVVSDLNQTVGKDIISLVDTNRLDIGKNTFFEILWSPDGSHMLIDAFVSAYSKEKPQLGGVYALYAANADGSGITRIAWAEATSSSSGRIITTPVWSRTGDYFAYVELLTGSMHKIKSAHLYIMSNDLNFIQEVELEKELSIFAWSPNEDKIAALVPEKIIIYDLDEKIDFSFSIPVDYTKIEDLAWSPDGKKIVFVKDRHDVITLDIEKRELNQIFSAELIGSYDAQWSPDSKKLIFYEFKSEERGVLNYDVYVMDEYVEKPIKIISFNSGSSRVVQWYPDSERLLVRIYSDDSYALYSLSITGEMKKLIESDVNIDGMVTPNGYILATIPNPRSKIPPYIRTYDLFLLNESDKLAIENVTYYTWKDRDVLFVKDNKISIFNTSTHDTWEISLPVPSKNSVRISLDPSGHFIAVENNIIDLRGRSNHIHTGNNTNSTIFEVETIEKKIDATKISTTKEPSELPGFTAIIAFAGVLIALGYMQIKK